METLNCTKCDGAGEKHSDYAIHDRTTGRFLPGMQKCHYCDGRGTFPALDVPAILSAIMTSRGPKRFRKSFPSPTGRGVEAVGKARAYYVWRWARFHGGADVTLPMTANLLIDGDPCQKQLDALAEMVAARVFGTDLAGAARWSPLLGGPAIPAGNLPPSASPGGPVHDGNDEETSMMLAVEGADQ